MTDLPWQAGVRASLRAAIDNGPGCPTALWYRAIPAGAMRNSAAGWR